MVKISDGGLFVGVRGGYSSEEGIKPTTSYREQPEKVLVPSAQKIPLGTDLLSRGLADLPYLLALSEGATFTPNDMTQLTVDRLLANNRNERITYAAHDQHGDKKTLKFVQIPDGKVITDLESKVRDELHSVNTVMNTDYRVAIAGPHYLTILGSYVDGENLRDHQKKKNKHSTPDDVRDFLTKTVRQLHALHQAGLVHRDIKPDNIIASDTPHGLDYNIIDFGSIKKDNTGLTTRGIDLSLGYTKIGVTTYRTIDDLYSLARTSYFLLEGKDPDFTSNKELDKKYDEQKLKELRIDENLHNILWKMLGHDEQNAYHSCDELLRKLNGKTQGNAAAPAAGTLATPERNNPLVLPYLNSTGTIPLLQDKIENIKQRFKMRYAGKHSTKKALHPEFISDLESILGELGYKRNTGYYYNNSSEFSRPHSALLQHLYEYRHSKKTDVLLMSKEANRNQYFRYFPNIDNDRQAQLELSKEFEEKDWRTTSEKIALWTTTAGLFLGGAAGGFYVGPLLLPLGNFESLDSWIGIVAGSFAGAVMSGVLELFGLPHAVGTGVNYLVNSVRRISYNFHSRITDERALAKALTPLPPNDYRPDDSASTERSIFHNFVTGENKHE